MMLDMKMHPLPFIRLESLSHVIKKSTEANSQKNRSKIYMTKIVQLNWFTVKHFYCWDLVHASLAVGGKKLLTQAFL